MRLIYVSDLHLRGAEEEKTKKFAAFLRELPQPGDTLIFGGDIFDLIVGNKDFFRKKYAELIALFQQLSDRNVEIFYLEGNHDFHIRGLFPRAKIIADDLGLEWQGKRIWVSHGDLIDPEDTGYRLLRGITRSIFFQIFLKCIPGFFVGFIGEWSSRQSRKHNNIYTVSEPRQRRLRDLYKEFAKNKIAAGSDFVLIGHSHIKDQLQLDSGGRTGEYINLGYSSSSIPYAQITVDSQAASFKEYP